MAILIENNKNKVRKTYLIVSILSTCSVLFIFKYFNFFNQNFIALAQFLHWNYSLESLSLILPIGLSFHTFQSLSYVIEVYRGNQKAERHFGIYSLYVMFFPQLVAGPIERAKNLLPQFFEKHKFQEQNFVVGLRLMLWGFFKKVVVADRVALYVNHIFNNYTDYTGIPLMIAVIFFGIQIYCDFSGYCDIAIGSARIMGFNLMQNFNGPYLAKNISEFWKRWHISLSTWFRDYVYIPLGGNRVTKLRWYGNLLIVFLISGLWHGANFTFIVWGFFHGFLMVLSDLTLKVRKVVVAFFRLDVHQFLRNSIRIILTYSSVTFLWIFFRSQTLDQAGYIIKNMFNLSLNTIVGKNIGISILDLSITSFFILFIFVEHLFLHYFDLNKILGKSKIFNWSAYIILVLLILTFGILKNMTFIYFQF